MKHRILIVEDDAVFLRPLLRVVEAEGYEVRAMQSGEAALELLRHEDFDLVLADKQLPKMDGIELVRQIKAGHPDVAIVVMTAHATVEAAVEALRLGAVDFLLKPFDLTEAPSGTPSSSRSSASPKALVFAAIRTSSASIGSWPRASACGRCSSWPSP